ncbi:MAG: hypothetical protein AAF721_35520, partial [Myxococcota bacterium]
AVGEYLQCIELAGETEGGMAASELCSAELALIDPSAAVPNHEIVGAASFTTSRVERIPVQTTVPKE